MNAADAFPSGDKVIHSVLALGGGEMLGRLVVFADTAFLFRQLVPAGFGVVGFAIAVNSYLALVVLGANQFGSWEDAHDPGRAALI